MQKIEKKLQNFANFANPNPLTDADEGPGRRAADERERRRPRGPLQPEDLSGEASVPSSRHRAPDSTVK